VLLATASFSGRASTWASSAGVITDKLPFASRRPRGRRPHERLRKRPGCLGSQVPVAVLMLKQGLGRLIRSATDRGILAVLDIRLLRKPYGRRFLESLPPARLVHDVEAVAGFMG
jgi:ATP-dependent DNA helicase DinG